MICNKTLKDYQCCGRAWIARLTWQGLYNLCDNEDDGIANKMKAGEGIYIILAIDNSHIISAYDDQLFTI